eukprot:Gb_25807 [translate_table: standard]
MPRSLQWLLFKGYTWWWTRISNDFNTKSTAWYARTSAWSYSWIWWMTNSMFAKLASTLRQILPLLDVEHMSLLVNSRAFNSDHSLDDKLCLLSAKKLLEGKGVAKDQEIFWQRTEEMSSAGSCQESIENEIQEKKGELQPQVVKIYNDSKPESKVIGVTSVSLLAVQSLSDISPVFFIGLLQVIVPAVIMNIYIVAINQVIDVDIDKINKPYLLIASGEFSQANGVAVTLASVFLSLGLGLLYGSQPLNWALYIGLVCGTAYSVEGSMSLLMCPPKNGFRQMQFCIWHHGGWSLKFLSWSLLLFLMIFLPNSVISVYVLLLIDFTHTRNAAWVAKDEPFWDMVVLVVSLVCYVATFSFSALLFNFFNPSGHDYTLNVFFIVMTLILDIAFTVIAMHPQYMCYGGLSSEPWDHKCNSLHDNHSSKAVSNGTLIFGMLTTIISSVVYFAVRAGSSTTFLSPPTTPCEGSRSPLLSFNDLEEGNDDEQKDEEGPVNWLSSTKNNEKLIDVGWPSVWVRICTEWITADFYFGEASSVDNSSDILHRCHVLHHRHSVAMVKEMTPFVKSVIWELKLQLRELYNLGLQNFLVSNVLSFDRMPGFVQNACQYGAVCGKTSMDLVSTHNRFLSEAIAELRELEDANFLILDLFSAFSCIVSKPSAYGFHKISESCCSTKYQNITYSIWCGDYYEKGRPLYRLSKSPERFVFFDWYHLTQSGWKVIVDLYYSNRGFV